MAESGGPVVGSVEVEVKARLDRFERDLEQVRRLSQNMQRDVQGGFDGIRGAIDRMSAPLMRFRMLWGAATAALGALQVLNAVRAFARLEQQQIAYNAVLRATGFGAGRTARDIENLADSLSRTTAATQSEVRQAATTLLTFRTIAGETFDEVLRLSQDLAATGFGSLATNARLLGRALEDPINGLTVLRRAHIVFSDAEQAVIKDMIETGRRAEAVDTVLQKLRSSVGGAGAAGAGTLTGAFSQLVDASGSLLELWGQELAQGFGLTSMYQRLTGSVLGYLDAKKKELSPEGRLARAQAAERAGAGTAAGIMPFPLELPLAPGTTQELLKAEVAVAQLLVDFKDLTEAAKENAAAIGLAQTALTTAQRSYEAVSLELEKETKLLKMTAVQRLVDKALRDANINLTTREGQAYAAQLEQQVRANFALKEGAGLLQARVGILGSAATAEEKLAAVIAAINKARDEGTISARDSLRAIGGARLDQVIEQESKRLSILGELARVSDVVAQKQREMTQAQVALNPAQREAVLQATALREELSRFGDVLTPVERYNKEMQLLRLQLQSGALDQEMFNRKVMQLQFPSLTSSIRQFTDWQGQVDQLVTGGLGRLSDALVDVASGTATTKEAFRSLALSVIRDLQSMIIKALLFRAVSSIFGFGGFGGVGAGVSAIGAGVIGAATMHRGGVVGVHGEARWVHPAYFENAPRAHSGARVGSSGLKPLRSNERAIVAEVGETILPAGAEGGGVRVSLTMNNDFRGADQNAVAALSVKVDQVARSVPEQVKRVIESSKGTTGLLR